MKHYLQYHNPDRMGYSCQELEGDTFWVVTRKTTLPSLGDMVWLVDGEGRPRQFYLCEVFLADRIEKSTDPNFRYRIVGTKGVRIRPLFELTFLPWFENLRQSLGNFGFGLSKISPEYVAFLDQAAFQGSETYRKMHAILWSD